MKEKLMPLYNTLIQVETKGASTKIMGDCLKYLENLINEAAAKEVEPVAE